MSEIVTTYMLPDTDTTLPMKRTEFYREQIAACRKTGAPTRSIEVVQTLLFTADGELILQKRSRRKQHNPGLIDKSLGGHIRFGETPKYTLMVETLQELEVPSFVLSQADDYKKTFTVLRPFLNNVALTQHIDGPRTYLSTKLIKGEQVTIANTYNFYLGIYSGPIKPADKEAAGILYFGYPKIRHDIREAPGQFTADLKFLLKKYQDEIREFLRVLG